MEPVNTGILSSLEGTPLLAGERYKHNKHTVECFVTHTLNALLIKVSMSVCGKGKCRYIALY